MKHLYSKVLTLVAPLVFLLLISSVSLSLNAQTEFITTWETSNTGPSDDETIVIPIIGGTFDIDWGDGTPIETTQTGPVTHTYLSSGEYVVTIDGDFDRINFNNSGDRLKLLEVNQWGTIAWTSMHSAFFGCENLTIPATDAPDLSNVTHLNRMFRNATSINQNINHWDVSNVVSMIEMFRDATVFNQDLSSWNVSSVFSLGMSGMFMLATDFNQDINSWDVSNVTGMDDMFRGASDFNQDISSWTVSNVKYMSGMFNGATNFDQDISGWDISNVEDMKDMFFDVTLSTNNYESILTGWDSQTLQSGLDFHGGNSQYCSVAATNAKANMAASDSWIITDGGLVAPTAVCLATPYTLNLDVSGNATLDPNDIDNGSTICGTGTLGLSLSQTAFTCADVALSPITVTLTVDDGNGNTDTCTATVNVVDNIAPVANLATLADVTAECEITSLTDPSATDNCGGTVTVTNDATLPITVQGTTAVTWTYTDVNSNTSTQTQNVVITDTTAPVPDAATLADVTDQCEVTSLTAPTATDNCGGTVTVTNDATFPITAQGTTVVTWTYTDVNSNTSTQTQNVVIIDTTAPVPDAATLADVTDQCEVTSLTAPTATDNCGGTVTVTNDATFPITAQGTTVVTWTYTDVNSNTSTQTQNVVITDTTAPVPDAATLADVTDQCEVTSLIDPTATDNCVGTVTVTNDATLPITSQGTTVVTWTYTDLNSNTSTQTQNVVITDIVDPVTPTLTTLNGQCSVTAIAPTTMDACAGTIIGTTSDPLTYNAQGTYTIVWNFDDGNGNDINVNQTVVVNDTVDPVTPTLTTLNGQCTVTATAPTTTDVCAGTIIGTTSDPLTYNAQGTYTIVWNFDDGNGNDINVNQTVIVDDTVDPVTPTLTTLNGQCTVTAIAPTTTDACAGTITGTTSDPLTYNTQGTYAIVWNFDDGNGNDINVNQTVIVDDTIDPVTPTLTTLNGQCSVTATAPTTTDVCAGTITGTTSDPLTYNAQGTYTIVWNFDDGNGNDINVNQTVIVDDTIDPVTPTLTTLNGQCSVTATAPTTTDVCAGTITGTTSDPLTYNAQGTYTIVWNFDDGNGNDINVNQTVIVDDTIDPVTPTLTTLNGQCSVTATAPTTTDVCAGTITGTTSDPLTYNAQGTYTIVWNFDDGNGNDINVNQTVIVDDTIDPTPNTVTLSNITAQCSVTSLTAPTATDNCSGVIVGLHNATLPITTQGTTVVIWTYDDGNGNTSTQTQNVIITDTTPPVVVCQNISITLDAGGNATITTSDIDNGSSDNCAVSSMSLDKYNFNCDDLGTNTLTLTVYDTSGNTDNCTATVTVLDPAASASVTIASNDANNEICLGENVTFTATPVNAGTTQFYEWFINGVSEGTTAVPTFTPVPAPIADYTIYVEMTTDLSACDPKVSNTLSIEVHPLPIVSVSDYDICIDDNTQSASPNTGGTWTSSNTGIATITNSGAITPVSSGTVTFTFTNSTTDCSSTTNNVTINALPVIGNYPTSNEICETETHTLSPSLGGTWTSSNNTVATISNAGVITGVGPGNATFTFTNTTTGCTATSTSIEVLEIPIITSVTASEDPVCAGDPSILTAIIQGAGGNNTTLVNYNFNSGNNYGALNGQEAPGIDSDIYEGYNMPFRTGTGTTTGGAAFTANNTAGNALRQLDDRRNDDQGYWIFDIDGVNLNTYQDFSIYFQTRRTNRNGNDKYINLYYRVNGTGNYIYFDDVFLNNNNQGANWQQVTKQIPAAANNANRLQIAVQVTDGYNSRNGSSDVLIDNFQVQATTVGETFLYSWAGNTGVNAGLPTGSGTPSNTNAIVTAYPEITTEYTVTIENSAGCTTTEIVTINVFPSPEIIILTDYCPADIPWTAQDESNMVQLVATANQPISSWTWLTDPNQTGDTIYVDIAGEYQVIGVTANGCSESIIQNVSQELVINGSFSFPAPTTDGPFADNMVSLGFDYDADYSSPFNAGYRYFENPILYQNRITITDDIEPFYPGIFRSITDHTEDAAAQYLAVNGNDLTLAVWRQVITVEPNTDYYFSAWGIDISNQFNNGLRPSDLTFRINGTDVGTPLYMTKGADWDRFYGIWNSGTNTTAIVEIRNINGDLQGNNFAIDDVSFATLSTFVNMTSDPGTDNQTVCQNSAITDITFDVGGGLTGPSSTGLPAGLTTSFDGLEYVISGTPTVTGTFNYTISTTANCGNKTYSGTIIVNPEPVVTITTAPATICASDGTIALSATLSGSATGGTWRIGGTNIATTVTGSVASATYTIATTGLTTFTFRSNNPSGPCGRAIETIDFNITPYIIADAGSNQTTMGCEVTTVTLAANNVTGFWTASPDTGYFDNATAHDSNFTGESGTIYTLTWTATNASPCGNTTDTVTISIPDCGTSLVFDGGDDYINFGDDIYDLDNTNFSIEAWVKTNNTSDTNTIISKRNGTSTASGYDLSLVGNRLYFRYNDSEVIANQTLNSSKWYHVAVTFSGTNYTLYIDGFPVRTIAGTSPDANTNKALVGATDRTDDSPINYFDGKIDEVRIWDTELSQAQIREMMNQEIKQAGSNVIGEVIPVEITGNLQWNNLIGYYQMSTGPQTNIVAGTINDISTVSTNPGKLNAMTIIQVEDAPIPYISRINNSWDNATTWSASAVQQIPNSKTNNVVPNNLQTWNIVRTTTNVSTNRSTTSPQLGKTTVLGLLVDNNTLRIESDQPLQVNKYLKIDGTLDLVVESQLLQPMGSIVDYTGTGKLERDQQGTGNEFNYNYWGSPVSNAGSAANRTYALASILYDGITPVSWITNNDAPGTSPATISSRWLYTYANLTGAYADWNRISQNTGISVGLGFTMKGSGNGSSEQNYTFSGQPNNGTITHTINGGNETLLGNPYPSAIDANIFITNNQDALLNGRLLFWEQSPTSNTHILSDYEGVYSYYNLTGGLTGTLPPSALISGIGDSNKTPARYIPVGQGFFVQADNDGGTLTFNNDQRVFIKEGVQSVFLRPSNDNQDYVNIPDGEESVIRRLRFNFTTPEGAVRHLLLGFTSDNAATDGVDYGYDALNADYFPSDLSFLIEANNYVIQGVGEFDETKVYPLDMVIGEQGNIEIGLTELENFDEAIDVYIFDAVEGTYTRFNDVNFQMNLEAGTYNDRFFLAFQEDATLSTIKEEFKDIMVRYLHDSDEIYVKTPPSVQVKQLYLINVAGQTVASWNATNLPMSNEIKIPVKHISEGNYIIKAETETATFNKKIIVKY
ncbi:BspA family leucine-rich repeat surface protein [Winogradskyella helgolandensis]|uniref:BspA family leucine-rich repeat surface protein n=1 Tax=Winogradskyella helgolandensis TaxID=2697010 RepID=UPI0015C1BFE3|nr:BspA family leucine-rich repeat surface protein [Winogradskyella helgolandensis]